MIEYHNSICLVKLYWLPKGDWLITVLGWILSPQKFMSSRSCKLELIWKRGSCICNQVKMKLYWIRLGLKSVMNGVLIERKKFGHRHTWT